MLRATLGFVLLLASCNTADSVTAPTSQSTSSQPATSQPRAQSWRLEITSSGGLTGRGLGSIAIENGMAEGRTMSGTSCASELTASEREELQRLVDAARPAAWQNQKPPAGSADMIEYTLTLRRGGETKSVTWTGEDTSTMPADLGGLFQTAWRIRGRACA